MSSIQNKEKQTGEGGRGKEEKRSFGCPLNHKGSLPKGGRGQEEEEEEETAKAGMRERTTSTST